MEWVELDSISLPIQCDWQFQLFSNIHIWKRIERYRENCLECVTDSCGSYGESRWDCMFFLICLSSPFSLPFMPTLFLLFALLPHATYCGPFTHWFGSWGDHAEPHTRQLFKASCSYIQNIVITTRPLTVAKPFGLPSIKNFHLFPKLHLILQSTNRVTFHSSLQKNFLFSGYINVHLL